MREADQTREMLENGEWGDVSYVDGRLSRSSEKSRNARLVCRTELLRLRPEATPQELYELSTCLGEFNPQLASEVIRAVFLSPTFSPLARFSVALNTVRLGNDDVAFLREYPELRKLVNHHARERLLDEARGLPIVVLRVLWNLLTLRWLRREVANGQKGGRSGG